MGVPAALLVVLVGLVGAAVVVPAAVPDLRGAEYAGGRWQ